MPKSALKRSGGKPKPIKTKSRGLRGHGRTSADIDFHSRVAALGCIACKMLEQVTLFPVRIHHIDGRNAGKENDYSERKVLPLCDQHHHPELAFDIGEIKPDLDAPSVHGRKKLFKKMVGPEEDLVLLVYDILKETPPWLNESLKGEAV